ncbi:MAG: CPBP family glutamic-type intramembrane protease [Candidatus Thermoplasmatota archaeon]
MIIWVFLLICFVSSIKTKFTAFMREKTLLKAYVYTAIFFAVMHISPAGFIPILIVGLVLAHLYRKLGIGSAIAAHSMNNFIPITLLFIFG